MDNLIIIGTSTNARHVYEFVRMYKLYNVIGFAVNSQYKTSETLFDLPIYELESLKEKVTGSFKVFIALLWNNLNRDRRELFEYCESKNFKFANLISPTAIIRKSSKLGRNCWVHDYVIIQNNTQIGDNVAIMAYTLIGADCMVGSHCFFGARSLLGGGSKIGRQSFVGLNSTIFDDTIIGEKCIIGACTSVKRNIPSYSKYITSSDNIIIKQYSEDEIENKLVFSKNKR